MGPSAFTAHIAFLQDTIRDLDCVVRESSGEVDRVERALADPIKDGGPSRQVLEPKLLQRQGEFTRARRKLDAVTAHLADVQAKWRKVEDRVIGHVVWAPPIAAASPHQYMQDVCVIKLDKDKFHHFAGNALGLIGACAFASRTCLSVDCILYKSTCSIPRPGVRYRQIYTHDARQRLRRATRIQVFA